MTTSEPTTGEIVKVLRENGDVYFGETEITCDQIADRLESQERENARLRSLSIAEKESEAISALTTRAEQAEAREKAAVADIPRMCIKCSSKTFDLEKEPCMSCFNNGDKPNWTWRGLPQEGEGL